MPLSLGIGEIPYRRSKPANAMPCTRRTGVIPVPTVTVRRGKDIIYAAAQAGGMFSFSERYNFSEGNNNEQKNIQRKKNDRNCGHGGSIFYFDAA